MTNKEVIEQKRLLFIDIENSLKLRHQKTKASYFQIYPDIIVEGIH